MSDIIEQSRRDYITAELPLLMREQLRRHRDRTLATWFLSVLDYYFILGSWWFPRLIYERRYEDGFVLERSEVRRTLAGYTISWGLRVDFYDDGSMMSEQPIWDSAFCNGLVRGKGNYWLPGCVKVQLREWLTYHLRQEIPDDVMTFLGEH